MVAQYNLAVMLDKGEGIKANKPQAAALYRAAAEQGMDIAILPHAKVLDQLQKPVAAYRRYLEAAEKGSVEAQYVVGLRQLGGLGVEADPAAGMERIKATAEAGYPKAALFYGVGLLQGQHGLEIDKEAGLAMVTKAAETGYIPAIMDLALIYDTGNGVEQDRTQALAYFEVAAKLGNPVAMNAVGERLLMGVGIEANPAASLDFFVAAIQAKNPMAMYNMGQIYESGIAGEANLEEAVKLYRAAVDLGVPQAQDKLVRACEGQSFPACFRR
jgi:TPR repeat protein